MSHTPADFDSAFGGLWIDQAGAGAELAARVAQGRIAPELAKDIAHFMENGFVILPGAASPGQVDALAGVIARAYAAGDGRLRYHTDGAVDHILDQPVSPHGKRIVEAHAVLDEARALLAAPAITAFLAAIFDEPPVLTQSLIFQTGSEQALHQDTAFVRFAQPRRMAAAWIALEDIAEGSGELRYMVKSHRLPDRPFSTGRLDSAGTPDEVPAFLAWLQTTCEERGLVPQTFRAKKGDALIWHAGLVHGGAPITRPGTTRQSLVGHYCPRSNRPVYGSSAVRKQAESATGLLYSSSLYDLNGRMSAQTGLPPAPGPSLLRRAGDRIARLFRSGRF